MNLTLNQTLRSLRASLEEASLEEADSSALKYADDPVAYNTALAKLMAKLKKDAGASGIRQGYKGTGKQSHRRQIWVKVPHHERGGPDVWLDNGYVQMGGVIDTPVGLPKARKYGDDSPETVYLWIRDALKAINEYEKAKWATKGVVTSDPKVFTSKPGVVTYVPPAEAEPVEPEVSPEVERVAKAIEKATDVNDHTGSIIILAKFLKAEKWVERLTALKALHSSWGSKPPGTDDIRALADKELFALAAGHLSPAEQNRLRSAF